MSDIFSILPIEAAADERLSKTQLRVLIALLSFRGKNTNMVWPSRETLSKRCGLPVNKISCATTELCALGWLKKLGNGGRSKASVYEVTVPDLDDKTLPNSVTVTESVTVTDSGSKTLPESGTKTLPDLGRGKEVTIELTKEVTIKDKAQAPMRMLTDLGVSEQTAKDFLTLRNAKKAPFTETALNRIKAEAEKAGFTLEAALAECASRGWQSFKAEWVNKPQQQGCGGTLLDHNQAAAAEASRRLSQQGGR
jgi:hypothetical protein